MTWKLMDKWRTSKRQHYWERPEYWGDSWRLEALATIQTPGERPSANANGKNSNEQIINNNNNDKNTDHLIPARRPDLINNQQKKEKLQNCWLCCPGGPQNKSEGKWKEG